MKWLAIAFLILLSGCSLSTQSPQQWSPDKVYSKGDACYVPIVPKGGIYWLSLQENNEGNIPPHSPNWWTQESVEQ